MLVILRVTLFATALAMYTGTMLQGQATANARPLCEAPNSSAMSRISVTAFLTWPGKETPDSMTLQSYQFVAQTIAEHYQAPRAVTIPAQLAWDAGVAIDTASEFKVYRPMVGELGLRIGDDGRVLDAALVTPTAVSEINTSIIDAVWRADSALAFTGLPVPPQDSRGLVHLLIGSGVKPQSVDVPFTRVSVPYLAVDDPVMPINRPNPRYPSNMQRSGIEGFVDLRFVVDLGGRAEPKSIHVLHASNFDFITPSVVSVQASTFKPAMFRGCAVRSVVTQRVRYSLDRSGINIYDGKLPTPRSRGWP